MVFENRVLWKIFDPRREEVTGCRRKIHSEWLRDLHCSKILLQ
jgi:hypothetical protein